MKGVVPFVAIIAIIVILAMAYQQGFFDPFVYSAQITSAKPEKQFVTFDDNFKIFIRIKNNRETFLQPVVKLLHDTTCFNGLSEKQLDQLPTNVDTNFFIEYRVNNRFSNCKPGTYTFTVELYNKLSTSTKALHIAAFNIEVVGSGQR